LSRARRIGLAVLLGLAGAGGSIAPCAAAEPPSRPGILTVGPGQRFASIAAAVAAARDGDTVQISPGTYVNDFAEINARITLRGAGGMVRVIATRPPPDGKAAFTVKADVTFENFEITGVHVPSLIGAAIRHQGGHLTVLASFFHHNQTGLLTDHDPSATLTVRRSEFAHNLPSGVTSETGLTHNLYAGGIARLLVEDSYFHDASLGHQLKSRAFETIIRGSRFADLDGTASYSIDLPNGGRVLLEGNVIEQGPRSDNPVIVAFGEEGTANGGQRPDSALTMRDNTVLNRLPGGFLLWNGSGAPAAMVGTRVFGLSALRLVVGSALLSGTVFLPSPPALDAAPPWRAGSGRGWAQAQ
jgi:hypothetical protein